MAWSDSTWRAGRRDTGAAPAPRSTLGDQADVVQADAVRLEGGGVCAGDLEGEAVIAGLQRAGTEFPLARTFHVGGIVQVDRFGERLVVEPGTHDREVSGE